MPTIGGNVLFSSNRLINSINNLIPIPSVAITLYSPKTKVGATILTNTIGNFEFTNVPKGEYILVESGSVLNAPKSPFDFTNAMTTSIPIPKDPILDNVSIPNIPQGTNFIDSLTPNTISIKINFSDMFNQHFVDGPVKYTPINILNNISTGNNLITLANNGDFGANKPSTPVNNSIMPKPYPGLATGFGYQEYSINTPIDGNVSIVNIQTLNSFKSWWNLTDHTTGSETGNFLVVNGSNPGASIFSQDINVKPETYYVFSSWVANQINRLGLVDPRFVLVITGKTESSAEIIYSQKSNLIVPSVTVPNWVQIGTIFNSKSYATVNVNFISEGKAATGNDYAIDDVSLKEVTINTNIIQSSKFVKNNTGLSGLSAKVGDTLTYTISIANISTNSTLVNVIVTDTLSNSLTLVNGSIKGGTLLEYDKNVIKISTDTIPIKTSRQISFEAIVNSNPTTTPNILNIAEIDYGISISPNLGPAPGTTLTNITTTRIDMANLKTTKNVSPQTVTVPQIVTYTIDIINNGDVSTNNILLLDTLPKEIVFNPGSLVINNLPVTLTTLANGAISITLPNINPGAVSNVKFDATVNGTISNIIINKVDVLYNFISSGTLSNTIISSSSIPLTVNINPTIPDLNIKIIKDASKQCLACNQSTIYTVTITNNSSTLLNNVIFYDTLPSCIKYVPNSLTVDYINYCIDNLDNGIDIGSIQGNSSLVISFKAKLICDCSPVITNIACLSYQYNSSTGHTCSNSNYIDVLKCKYECKCRCHCTKMCCYKNKY